MVWYLVKYRDNFTFTLCLQNSYSLQNLVCQGYYKMESFKGFPKHLLHLVSYFIVFGHPIKDHSFSTLDKSGLNRSCTFWKIYCLTEIQSLIGQYDGILDGMVLKI